MKVRKANADEAALFERTGYETTVLLLEGDGVGVLGCCGVGAGSGGGVLGRVCLSRALGCVFAHDWWVCPEAGKSGAAMLFFAARAQLREWGVEKLHIHFEESAARGQERGERGEGSGRGTKEFWLRKGARPIFTMYELEI